MSDAEKIYIDEATFVAAYDAHWKELYLAGCRYLENHELAKEMVQDVFISVWEKRDSLVVRTSLRNYLFGALKLKVLGHYRKRSVSEQYVIYQQANQHETAAHATEEQVFFNELNKALGAVVKSLPERSRAVYQLSWEKGLDNKSIARALLISEKAVEGNMTRALRFIRQKLRKFRPPDIT